MTSPDSLSVAVRTQGGRATLGGTQGAALLEGLVWGK